MSLFTGKGGSVTKDGTIVANVKQWSASEQQSNTYGCSDWDIKFDVYLDSSSTGLPFRHGQVFDIELKLGDAVSWSLPLMTRSQILDISTGSTISDAVALNVTARCTLPLNA